MAQGAWVVSIHYEGVNLRAIYPEALPNGYRSKVLHPHTIPPDSTHVCPIVGVSESEPVPAASWDPFFDFDSLIPEQEIVEATTEEKENFLQAVSSLEAAITDDIVGQYLTHLSSPDVVVDGVLRIHVLMSRLEGYY